MTPKRIGFIGVHNGGKDTLTTAGFSHLKKAGKTCYLITEGAEQAIMQHIDLKTTEGQLWLIGRQMEKETEAINFGKREYIICNRTVLDGIAYSKALGIDRAHEIEMIAWNFHSVFPYDLIFWLRSLPQIQDDGVRMTDPVQQEAIDLEFLKIVKHLMDINIPVMNIQDSTKASREKRIKKILDSYIA